MSIKLGKHSYMGAQCNVRGPGCVKVGNFCSLADQITFEFLSQHHYERVSTYPFLTKNWSEGKGDGNRIKTTLINVGSDVWIGSGATILAGADLGDGCIVGAHSIVASPVTPYAIVAGNPAKVVKYRFAEDIIKALLEIKWWMWDDNIIRTRLDDFYKTVEVFTKLYKVQQ